MCATVTAGLVGAIINAFVGACRLLFIVRLIKKAWWLRRIIEKELHGNRAAVGDVLI